MNSVIRDFHTSVNANLFVQVNIVLAIDVSNHRIPARIKKPLNILRPVYLTVDANFLFNKEKRLLTVMKTGISVQVMYVTQ